ncbi:MAG: hypothetical protein ACOH13_10215 [Flavobacteriales bacterium]
MKIAYALLVCLVLPALLSAQNTGITWSAPVTCGSPAQGGTRARVVVNGNGDPVVLWGRVNDPADFVAVGDGSSFGPPQQVSYPGTPPAVDFWMGADIAALGNELWICYKATPEATMPAFARRSLDGGLTWGDTVRITDDVWTRFPSIAIGTAGGPVVQYMQFDANFSNARQVTTRMVGGTFQPPVEVSAPFAPGQVCDCCPNQVTADGTTVVPLYRNAGPDIRVMYGAVSQDAGATYPIGGLLDPTGWNLSQCPSSGPDGYIAGDSVRYVWMSGATNGTKVYLASAALADLSHTAALPLLPGQGSTIAQNYPRIAGSGDTLGIVWEQAAGGARNILFSWSTTGMAGLSAPDTVNTAFTGAQRIPDIAYANGAFHIVWSDVDAGVARYRRADLATGTGVGTVAQAAEFQVWPLPARDALHVAVSGDREGQLRLFSPNGQCVWTGTMAGSTIDVSGFVSGPYVLKAKDAAGNSLGTVIVPIIH